MTKARRTRPLPSTDITANRSSKVAYDGLRFIFAGYTIDRLILICPYRQNYVQLEIYFGL